MTSTSVTLFTGNVESVLSRLPGGFVHACVTSPPYFGLRNYLPKDHPDKHLEIGREDTPKTYVSAIVSAMREVRRVLRDDGTCWIVIADSYAGTGGHTSIGKTSQRSNRSNVDIQNAEKGYKPDGFVKEKDLIGIPWMLAFALRDDGWYLRQDTIWAKPNPMPESMKDRCTKSHEYVFMLTKSPRYFFDHHAIKEDSITNDPRRPYTSGGAKEIDGRPKEQWQGGKPRTSGNVTHKYTQAYEDEYGDETHRTKAGLLKIADVPWSQRNQLSVWTMSSEPVRNLHYATFPTRLVSRCLEAATSAHGCCIGCGAPYRRMIDKGEPDMAHRAQSGADSTGVYTGQSTKDHTAAGVQDASATKARILEGMVVKRTSGWEPTCTCPPCGVSPPVVLDPFSGAGTTALVATRLGCDAIGIDLNSDYHKMAVDRLTDPKAKCLNSRGERVPFRPAEVSIP